MVQLVYFDVRLRAQDLYNEASLGFPRLGLNHPVNKSVIRYDDPSNAAGVSFFHDIFPLFSQDSGVVKCHGVYLPPTMWSMAAQ